MATHACMQVVAPLVVTPSTSLAAVANTAVTFSTGALTGLTPNTDYVAVLDGNGCFNLGTSNALGALAPVTVIPLLSRRFYDVVGTRMPALTVYTSLQCGSTLGAVARGTATIMVSFVFHQCTIPPANSYFAAPLQGVIAKPKPPVSS